MSIIAGGPGTGKTHTVARLLAAAHLIAAAEGRDLEAALAAPTGKAAVRMGEAVAAEVAALAAAGLIGADLAARLAGPGATDRSTGCWGGARGPTFDTTASTRCPTTWSSSMRRPWSRCP